MKGLGTGQLGGIPTDPREGLRAYPICHRRYPTPTEGGGNEGVPREGFRKPFPVCSWTSEGARSRRLRVLFVEPSCERGIDFYVCPRERFRVPLISKTGICLIFIFPGRSLSKGFLRLAIFFGPCGDIKLTCSYYIRHFRNFFLENKQDLLMIYVVVQS